MTTRSTRRARRYLAGAASAAVLFAAVQVPQSVASAARTSHPKPTIVLVHGAWADGSSWHGVAERLQDRGYAVLVPPNPLRGPTAGGDSAYLASFLGSVSGPVVLVGHSYGGIVISNAANGNANVKALVFVDAFVPQDKQPLGALTTTSCLNVDTSKSFRPVPFAGGVDLYVQRAANPPYAGFDACFANGIAKDEAAVLAAGQRPLSAAALGDPSGPPAWMTIPSWALIGTQDRVIPPEQQITTARMAHIHIDTFGAGHLGLISQPDAVVRTILKAVDATD